MESVFYLHAVGFGNKFGTALSFNTTGQFFYSPLSSSPNSSTLFLKPITGSCPKIGWDSEVDINHIRLVDQITKYNFGIKRESIHDLFSDDNLRKCETLILDEFHCLLSPERIYVVNRCLEQRIEEIRKVI
jgi:hypothetical protein